MGMTERRERMATERRKGKIKYTRIKTFLC